jgi:Ca2+-transporting ATPase
VEQGRGIYDNIRKTLQYLLGGNSGELLLMTVCVTVGLPSPLFAVQLLWINLITDGLPALCLAVDPIDPDVMKRKPRRPDENITDRGFLPTMALTGLLTGGTTLAVYLAVLWSATPELARSAAFAVLVFAELLRAFGARSESKSVWRIPFFSNPSLVAVVFVSVALQLWSQHSGILERVLKTSSMPLSWFFALLALGTVPLFGLEIAKVFRDRFKPEIVVTERE